MDTILHKLDKIKELLEEIREQGKPQPYNPMPYYFPPVCAYPFGLDYPPWYPCGIQRNNIQWCSTTDSNSANSPEREFLHK